MTFIETYLHCLLLASPVLAVMLIMTVWETLQNRPFRKKALDKSKIK